MVDEILDINDVTDFSNSNENIEVLDNKEDEVEDDPREELVNRLLEYQAYKDITKVLQEKELLRRDIYTKTPENIKNYIDFCIVCDTIML